MKTLILGILQQFIGYGISIIVFGHGVPTQDRVLGNSFGWLIFSVPILVYLIVCAVVASQYISRARLSSCKYNRHAWRILLAFAFPGLCITFGSAYELFQESPSTTNPVFDFLCVLIIPALSLWSARGFVRNFASE